MKKSPKLQTVPLIFSKSIFVHEWYQFCRHKKCLCFVEFDAVEEITLLAFQHQGNMDDWLIIEKIFFIKSLLILKIRLQSPVKMLYLP